MSLPEENSITNREIIIGGGVHAAIYAATRAALRKPAPVVFEETPLLGGIFAHVIPFSMNSSNDASVESVERGPSRIPRTNTSDDINYLPNSEFQVRDYNQGTEYPRTNVMSTVVRRTLHEYAANYTSAYVKADSNGNVYGYTDKDRSEGGVFLGTAKRIIFATGLRMIRDWDSAIVKTAQQFLKEPIMSYQEKRVAIVGGGDSAATIAEFLTGQGISQPYNRPDRIDWYGGTNMPQTKKQWALNYHARYMGLSRHFPEGGKIGVIRPFPVKGFITPMGNTALVNGRFYDVVIDATGFKPNTAPFNTAGVFRDTAGHTVARWDYGRRYVIGAAADLGNYNVPTFDNRFPASNVAIYNIAPLTASLAAILD